MKTTMDQETLLRRRRCLQLLSELHPEAGGLMLFGRVNIYYFTGFMGSGVFWMPREGEPLLLVRKGAERVKLENSDLAVGRYRYYGDIAREAEKNGSPLSPVIAAEQAALPWSLAENLVKKLPETRFVNADLLLSRLRAVKSPYELALMREAGARHAKAVEEELPKIISPGMTEMQVARCASDVFYALGSCGLTRMNAFGEEMLLGEVSVGGNGNYPTFYNGPLGCRGAHAAAPFLGSPEVVWKEGELLTVDAGFCYAGYNSDKTVCYFAGAKEDIPGIVRKAHEVCCEIEAAMGAALRPGAVPSALYKQALLMAEKAGFAEGFMGLGGNKVPFLGHGIGLCIDEWPVLAARFDRPLEAGVTMAVEPKIGIEGVGMVGTENTWEVSEEAGRSLSGRICDIICVG